jgi:hypothetical protein
MSGFGHFCSSGFPGHLILQRRGKLRLSGTGILGESGGDHTEEDTMTSVLRLCATGIAFLAAAATLDCAPMTIPTLMSH